MQIQNIKGTQFVEAKEAITDALLNMTYRFVSGEGDDGAFVFGDKPSRKFVSGFLLPQFDDTGIDDETNDIHISSMGIDFQVHNPPVGELAIDVCFSIYVRVLPTWEEIIKYQLKPINQFSAASSKLIRDEIKKRTDFLNAQEQSKSEGQRIPKATIKINAKTDVYKEMGIIVPDPSEIAELTKEIPDDTEDNAERVAQPAEPETVLVVEDVRVKIPDALAKPADIPQKWRRFSFRLECLTIKFEDSELQVNKSLNDYSEKLCTFIFSTVNNWIESTEGQFWAYRKVDTLPSHYASKEAWENLLVTLRKTSPDIAVLLPNVDKIKLAVVKTANFSDNSILNYRLCLENQNKAPGRKDYLSHDSAIHQVHLCVTIPKAVHSRLYLERIQPSYRFRNFMRYPAIGINCGIKEGKTSADKVALETTWLPKYILPRITPRAIAGVPWKYLELGDTKTEVSSLYRLVEEYNTWIDTQQCLDPAEYERNPSKRHEEETEFNNDLNSFRKENALIKRGIDLLNESQEAYRTASDSRKAIPYRAWLLLNKSMAKAGQKKDFLGWRLFQEAFIIAHIPTIVSRMHEFAHWHDNQFDEEFATLLYFPTGGGKSEAFYGLLIFNLFFDRMRGKNRGVTSLIRYPLRLLTLQQAQRLFDLLSHVEKVKHEESIGGAPFEIGFWVGSANTPNNNGPDSLKGIIKFGDKLPQPGTDAYSAYRQANDSYNKIPLCPYCDMATGIRYLPSQSNRIAIYCFNDECDWTQMNGGITPLPFLLTDTDIYAHAPAIILGTIDKLALIGQHNSTINKFVGMFGFARFIDDNGRLTIERNLQKEFLPALENLKMHTVAPAFPDGREVFFDPFPSLIVQDEAHLLEESLGTFAGLFETTLEQLFVAQADLLGNRVSRAPNGKPRMPKIVAATATISTPKRQMESLYQRDCRHFPSPGTSIYEGFFAHPATAPNTERQGVIDSSPHDEREKNFELYAPWMRVYATIMTNGRLHTVTTVNVLGAFHVIVSKLWQLIQDDCAAAVELFKNSLSETPLKVHHSKALDAIANDPEELLSLLDLFRISLTYVTNKKGGDQVIDALSGESGKLHLAAGIPMRALKTDLISGGVDVKTIQEIMREASKASTPEGLSESLRNIVATSAISHGVDVDKFNAMFFAGMPSDIAEYIQASSRVGRTHVGFSLLIPTPQKRRDRYIVEVHDIFHRFRERMIAPAAIERWAENALIRVIPSLFQAWLNGFFEQKVFMEASDRRKVYPIDNTFIIKRLINKTGSDEFNDRLGSFVKKAVGIEGRGKTHIGKPNNQDFYIGTLLNGTSRIVEDLNERADTSTPLHEFWTHSAVAKQPMKSLRDIDDAGTIRASMHLPERLQKGIKPLKNFESIVIATKYVRKQLALVSEMESDGEV